jgi:segregation and condensation protein A
LLHLIRKNEVDIYDIPIALITKQYLDYLEVMQELNIHLAGDFLVMASTLTHIKSRMLLPSYHSDDDDEDGQDPREELVEQLKEHIRIKAAADHLDGRFWLDRDVFPRAGARQEVEQAVAEADQGEVIAAGLFDLIAAFRTLMAGRQLSVSFNVPVARISVEERMSQVLDILRQRQSLQFTEFFGPDLTKGELVVTFLSLLELTRLGLIRVYQERQERPISEGGQWGVLRIMLKKMEEIDQEGGQ